MARYAAGLGVGQSTLRYARHILPSSSRGAQNPARRSRRPGAGGLFVVRTGPRAGGHGPTGLNPGCPTADRTGGGDQPPGDAGCAPGRAGTGAGRAGLQRVLQASLQQRPSCVADSGLYTPASLEIQMKATTTHALLPAGLAGALLLSACAATSASTVSASRSARSTTTTTTRTTRPATAKTKPGAPARVKGAPPAGKGARPAGKGQPPAGAGAKPGIVKPPAASGAPGGGVPNGGSPSGGSPSGGAGGPGASSAAVIGTGTYHQRARPSRRAKP